MGWPPTMLLLPFVPILLLLPLMCHGREAVGKADQWSPAIVDQLQPFKLTEKRVHEQPRTIGAKRRRAKPVNGAEQLARGELSADWQPADSDEAKLLEQIPTIGPHGEFAFQANESLLHLRTPIYELRHGQCLEVRFRVEGKRTRLLLYTCRMFEGGLCVLDKFLATTAHKKLDNNNNAEADQLDVCHKMQPWMFAPSPFAFHFRFVRRPRKFADKEAELRHFRRRHGRHATREVGRVQLGGFHPCKQACQDREEGKEEEEQQQLDIPEAAVQDRHAEDPLEGWGKR